MQCDHQGVSEPAAPSIQRVIFRVPTSGLIAVGFLALCATPLATTVPGLAVLYVIPVALAAWVIRSRTVVDANRLVPRRLLGATTLAWTEIASLKLPKRGWVTAVRADGGEVPLPGVRLRHLPMLAALSGGRLDDPTAERPAAE